MHFLFPFPFFCLPHPVHCPPTKMPRYPKIRPFLVWRRPGWPTGHLDNRDIETLLLRCIGNWAIDFALDALLLLTIAVMGPFTRPPADQRLFGLLPAMLSYLGFLLRTSGSSAALFVVSYLKMSWLLLHPGFQDSTWERQLSGYLATRSGCQTGLRPRSSTAVFRAHRINSFTYPRHVYQQIVKLLQAFHSSVFDMRGLDLQCRDVIGAGHWISASRHH